MWVTFAARRRADSCAILSDNGDEPATSSAVRGLPTILTDFCSDPSWASSFLLSFRGVTMILSGFFCSCRSTAGLIVGAGFSSSASRLDAIAEYELASLEL